MLFLLPNLYNLYTSLGVFANNNNNNYVYYVHTRSNCNVVIMLLCIPIMWPNQQVTGITKSSQPTVNIAIIVTNQDYLNTCTSQNSVISKCFPCTYYQSFIKLNSYSYSASRQYGDQW